jgi:periplasmic protein CpxP/Spy
MASVKHVLGLGTVVVALAASGLAIASNQGEHSGDQRDSKMQMRMEKRMDELKAKLAITAAQEDSWRAFQDVMQPPAMDKAAKRAQHEAMQDMTTPQRIDARTAMQEARMAQMQARNDATKALYASLSPAQQKTFDAVSMKIDKGMHGGKHDDKHGGKHGDMEKDGHGK